MLVNMKSREKRFAYLFNNKLERLYIEQPQQKSAVGNIYVGIVTKVAPGMNAAFVDIGEVKNCYLPKDKLASYSADDSSFNEKKNRSISTYIKQGEKVLVQVVKDATGTKGPKLTGIVELQKDNLVYMPYGRYIAVSKKLADQKLQQQLRSVGKKLTAQSEGLIFRTSAANASEAELTAEVDELRQKYTELLRQAATAKKPALLLANNDYERELFRILEKMESGEVFVDTQEEAKGWSSVFPKLTFHYYADNKNLFSFFAVEKDIEDALKRIVWLEKGAYLIIDETEAATIIDVNTGKYEGKHNLEQTAFDTNRYAALEAARQLKVRDLSGIILIDFIDMPKEHERKIEEIMKKELQKDSRQTKVIGFTALGILQITRKKTVVPLSQAVKTKCPVCDGTGAVMSAESMAFKLERELWEYERSDHDLIEVEAQREVIKVFSGKDKQHLKRLEEILGMQITLHERDFAIPDYHIKYIGQKNNS
ncbi:Rne/Rng family ribonuclease [Niallia taxi]|nr:Rne/Rng family ribonuclease [Niallia taxi]MED4037451.1 Rne/Rng family ribonuclease [Niallia taxi]MED4055896.1 Rne/Rng family ribonuclease [Niallia taxi]MED4117892.1 Rne/Rng family ribonuclease [Niallia taxi]